VIGAILVEPDRFDEIASVLKAEDFFHDRHSRIFSKFHELTDKRIGIDQISLGAAMGYPLGTYNREWDDQLERLLRHPHCINANYHAGVVRDMAVRRAIKAWALTADEEASTNDPTIHGKEIVAKVEAALFEIDTRESGNITYTAAEAADEALAEFEAHLIGQPSGIRSMFADLDDMVGGFHGGQLIILAGRPGSGKSALAVNIAENVITQLGSEVFFVSMEMTRKSLMKRIACSHAKLDSKKLKRPKKMTAEEVADYRNGMSFARALNLHIIDGSDITLHQIASGARWHKRRNNIELIVVDYLQLIDTQPQRGESREQQIARVSRRLKGIARELDVPVIALASLNRGSENREDHTPRMSDLRESGQIESDADVVMLLHLAWRYSPKEIPGLAKCIIAKNREGATGVVDLTFVERLTQFYSVYRETPAIPEPSKNGVAHKKKSAPKPY